MVKIGASSLDGIQKLGWSPVISAERGGTRVLPDNPVGPGWTEGGEPGGVKAPVAVVAAEGVQSCRNLRLKESKGIDPLELIWRLLESWAA